NIGQRLAKRSQFIIDSRWHAGMDDAPNDAVPLQRAQGLGEHFLRYALDHPLQFAKTMLPPDQRAHDQNGPFVGNAVQNLPCRAGLLEGVPLHTLRLFNSYQKVPLLLFSAYLSNFKGLRNKSAHYETMRQYQNEQL